MHVNQMKIWHIHNYITAYHTFVKILNIILTKDGMILNVVLTKDVIFKFKMRNNCDIPNARTICLEPRYMERNSP